MSERSRRRVLVAVTTASFVIGGLVMPSVASAATVGQLTQRSQCFAAATTGCTARAEMGAPGAVAVSPDGKSVYAADENGSVTAFSRSSTGALTPIGCYTSSGATGCTTVRALGLGFDAVVSADGRSLYVLDLLNAAIAVFDRNTTTGALVQPGGLSGCVNPGGGNGCAAVGTLNKPTAIEVSNDGTSAYVAANGSSSLLEFSRASDGSLTYTGCLGSTTNGCVDEVHLGNVTDVAVSPDSKNVYTAGTGDSTVNVYTRDATTGVLTNLDCFGVAVGCTPFRGQDQVHAIALSRDGRSAYLLGGDPFTSSHVVMSAFNRSTTTGNLTQKSGNAGCFSRDGKADSQFPAGTCSAVRGLGRGMDLAVSPDGADLYVMGGSAGTVAILRRATTGTLSQPSGAAGCISPGGTGQCATAKATGSPSDVAFSPKPAAQLYIASSAAPSGLTAFDRHLYPGTTITAGPSGTTADHTPTFRFKSTDAGSTFQCKVGSSASYKKCASPFTTAKLSKGKHTFFVRAVNNAGYKDLTPATRTFTVS